MRAALLVLAAGVLGAVAANSLDSIQGAEAEGNFAPIPGDDSCALFLNGVVSDKPIPELLAEFMLPAEIIVPATTFPDRRHCLGHEGDSGPYVVAVAIEDSSGTSLWVALSDVGRTFEDFSEVELLTMYEDEGFDDLRPTSYGFTNSEEIPSQGEGVNLWDLVATVARKNED